MLLQAMSGYFRIISRLGRRGRDKNKGGGLGGGDKRNYREAKDREKAGNRKHKTCLIPGR